MRQLLRICSATTALCMILILFSGCLQRSKAPYQVDRFILDYPSPVFSGLQISNESIRVDRFSVAQAYNTTAMVYRPAAFRLDSYTGSRWSIHPADMINDLLVRDLRSARFLAEVFPYQSDERVRYTLDGFIDQFCEYDEGPLSTAVLSINVILFDQQAGQSSGRFKLQKTYRYSNRISEKTAEALAKGMTKNVEDFSKDLIQDLSSLFR